MPGALMKKWLRKEHAGPGFKTWLDTSCEKYSVLTPDSNPGENEPPKGLKRMGQRSLAWWPLQRSVPRCPGGRSTCEFCMCILSFAPFHQMHTCFNIALCRCPRGGPSGRLNLGLAESSLEM